MSTSTVSYLGAIVNNTDKLTLVVTILIAILGWIVALLLQRNNVKHQHKIDILYDIYKQFVQLHMEMHDSLSSLGAKSSPPFILMESCMISFSLKFSSEQESVYKGEQEWLKYYNELYKTYSDFSEKYLRLSYLFNNWLAAFKPLLPTMYALSGQVNLLKEKIYADISIIQMYTTKNGHDWRKWDKAQVEKISNNIKENSTTIGCYLGDFMVLLHNELLSKYFRKKRSIRKTLGEEYKVLTKKGIIVNLDHKLISKMAKYKLMHDEKVGEKIACTSDPVHKEYLEFLVKSVCPVCKNEIQIINMVETKNGFIFYYICGHSWKDDMSLVGLDV